MSSPEPPARARLALALAYMMVMGALWGLQFSLAKIGMRDGIAPAAWILAINLVGAPVLLGIAAWRGTPPSALRGHVRYALIAGATAVAVPHAVLVTVMSHVPAGLAAVLSTLSPLMTYSIALAVGMATLHRLRVAGLGFGLLGALLVLGPRASLPDPAMWPWVALCLTVPLFYAISNVYIARQRPDGIDSIALAGAMQLGSLALIAPLALAQGLHLPLPPAHAGDWALLFQAGIGWVGSLLFFEVLRLAGPVFFSQTGSLVTLWGVFWGWLFFGETHSLYIWAAMASILTGLVLVTRAGR
jgi:drug/metabolite transporter (DMT)-like permease